MKDLILPTAYLPPLLQMALIVKSQEVFIDGKEHFIKQSFRNRTQIYGANGVLNLTIPIKKWKNHTPTEKIEISSDESWQNQHWKSIESAYRTSPFFEFYEEDIKPLLFQSERNLLKFNQLFLKEILEMIGGSMTLKTQNGFVLSNPDFRSIIHPRNEKIEELVTFPKYIQVFEEKQGFKPNLGILDLLFNLGPQTLQYLQQITISKEWQRKSI